jgi:hypothetical protein
LAAIATVATADQLAPLFPAAAVAISSNSAAAPAPKASAAVAAAVPSPKAFRGAMQMGSRFLMGRRGMLTAIAHAKMKLRSWSDGGVLLAQEERCFETRRLAAAWSASTNMAAMFVQIILISSESSFVRFLL